MRILIVEDDRQTQEVMQIALQAPDIVIDLACSLAEARSCLGRDSYDWITVDHHLGDGFGLDLFSPPVTEALASRTIMITGNAKEPELREEVRRLRIPHLISKPFSVTALRRLIRSRELPGRVGAKGGRAAAPAEDDASGAPAVGRFRLRGGDLAFVDLDRVAARAFGLADEGERFSSRTLRDLLPEAVCDRVRTALTEGDLLSMESDALQSAGAGRPVWLAVWRGGDGEAEGLVRDVRRPRDLERRLARAEPLCALGQLASGMAHDFNNQLSCIIGYATLIKQSHSDDAQLQRQVDTLLRSADISAHLIRQILRFARPGAGEDLPVDLHQLIGDVVEMLSHCVSRQIGIAARLEAGRCLVRGSRAQLESALVNLVLNARDAMPNGGRVEIATSETILPAPGLCLQDAPPPGAFLRIDVTDTGEGIAPEHRDRIFEPFFTTKAGDRGTGLGLTGVLGAVRRHGGAVAVASAPGEGATFSLFLPLLPAATAKPEDSCRSRESASGLFRVAERGVGVG